MQATPSGKNERKHPLCYYSTTEVIYATIKEFYNLRRLIEDSEFKKNFDPTIGIGKRKKKKSTKLLKMMIIRVLHNLLYYQARVTGWLVSSVSLSLRC